MMSTDLRIVIRPDNGQYLLDVTGWPVGAPVQSFQRNAPALTANELDELRRGTAPPPTVYNVISGVSQWVLGADLHALLVAALNQVQDPLRLIFEVRAPQSYSVFSDLPIELIQLQQAVNPLVLDHRVGSIVHLLPKVGSPPAMATANGWPLSVLIVRSNPHDLGGAVPAALPIRQQVLNILPEPFVNMDILSREVGPGVKGLPTRSGLVRQLQRASYDILVYLGHGDLIATHADLPPIGALELENQDGSAHDPMAANQLAAALHNWPVPAVILVGCMTAADLSAAAHQVIDPVIPKWMRGSQGVAQALINSESGVQIAVGMRFQIETADARVFLEGFFTSLLQDRPGHVEEAVRAGRNMLNLLGQQGYGWSAPMVFSTLASEPLFGFLATSHQCPAAELYNNARAIFWRAVSQIPLSLRTPEQINPLLDSLEKLNQEINQNVAAGVTRLVPTQLEVLPGQTGEFPVWLHGALNVEEVEGRLVVGGQEGTIGVITPSQELLQQGYQVLTQREAPNQALFVIKRFDNQANPLPTGAPLFRVQVTAGNSAGVVYPVNIEGLRTDPPQLVCPGNDAIIVPRP